MRKGKDRREAERISYVCEVECEGAGLNRLATRINDLSITGAFIDSMTCYAPGTVLNLRFYVLDTLIGTTAQVRYCMPQMGMGVQFLDLQPDHVAALERLVEGRPSLLAGKPSETGEVGAPSANDSNSPEDVLLGNFAVVSMFDLIQIIENNRLGGALALMSPAATGEIHFNEGQIVGAHSALSSGTDALKNFLDVTEGSFEFRRTTARYPSTIDAPSNMSLMLDLLRAKDEETAAQR